MPILASVISMIISSITPIKGDGLTYVHTLMTSTNSLKSSGDAILAIKKNKELQITLKETGLLSLKDYELYLSIDSSDTTKNTMGIMLGQFKTNAKGQYHGKFVRTGMSSIPELGFRLLISDQRNMHPNDFLVSVPNQSVVMSGELGGIPTILQQTEVGIVDSRYVCVGYISPDIPFNKKNAKKYNLNPEMYFPISKHRMVNTFKIAQNHLILQVGVHVFDLKNGSMVYDLPIQLSLQKIGKKKRSTIPYLIPLYNQQYGYADTNLANLVSLQYGQYRMIITYKHTKLILSNFQVTESSGFLINPLQAQPIAKVSEQDGEFIPSRVTIKVDQKIRFYYNGVGYESLMIGKLRSSLLYYHQYWDHVFAKKGAYTISLAYAPSVKMRVIVK